MPGSGYTHLLLGCRCGVLGHSMKRLSWIWVLLLLWVYLVYLWLHISSSLPCVQDGVCHWVFISITVPPSSLHLLCAPVFPREFVSILVTATVIGCYCLSFSFCFSSSFCYSTLFFFFFFETEFRCCYPDWSVMARPRLTATSASWVQVILPPQPPE